MYCQKCHLPQCVWCYREKEPEFSPLNFFASTVAQVGLRILPYSRQTWEGNFNCQGNFPEKRGGGLLWGGGLQQWLGPRVTVGHILHEQRSERQSWCCSICGTKKELKLLWGCYHRDEVVPWRVVSHYLLDPILPLFGDKTLPVYWEEKLP